MLDKRLGDLWYGLQGKKPHLPHFLSEVRLSGIRGIEDLRVAFDYPVSVIAGGNASGKSTELFAAACAYRVPEASPRAFLPSTLFPSYLPKHDSTLKDSRREVTIEYHLKTPRGSLSMRWARRRGWNRSFFGRKGAKQPERAVYLRTPANLSNPSEARGLLRLSSRRTPPETPPLTVAQIDFAHQILPFKYKGVATLSGGSGRSLLFAEQRNGSAYSELHMAAGERAILRLSRDVSQLKGALVLIDEVEAGLHPWVQQLLMLHLQQLALRNDLQVIVTSHSPVVLDSVPPPGRVFLERDEAGGVSVLPPYRDIIQDALYGRANDTLNLLCEDSSAEAILDGVLDALRVKLSIRSGSVRVGRNTGADEFPSHVAAFRKFGRLRNLVLVLDGDQRDSGVAEKIRAEAADSLLPILYLPGSGAPEQWVWERLQTRSEAVADALATSPAGLAHSMAMLDSVYDDAADSAAEIAKTKLHNLSGEVLKREVAEVCRLVARSECAQPDSDIQPLLGAVEDQLLRWRAG